MRCIFTILFVQLAVFSVMAERIIKRQNYDLIIASDTIYEGENYELTVDFKGNKNVQGVSISYPYALILSDTIAYVKFTAGAGSYDIKGISKQRFKISIVTNQDTLFEYIDYVIQKIPSTIRPIQDSLTTLLAIDEVYKHIPYVASYTSYFEGFAYELGNDLLKKESGELFVLVIVDSKGKVSRYDIIKNTYKTIPLQEIENRIGSYQLNKNFKYNGKLKFSVVICTFKGYRGNFIDYSER